MFAFLQDIILEFLLLVLYKHALKLLSDEIVMTICGVIKAVNILQC